MGDREGIEESGNGGEEHLEKVSKVPFTKSHPERDVGGSSMGLNLEVRARARLIVFFASELCTFDPAPQSSLSAHLVHPSSEAATTWPCSLSTQKWCLKGCCMLIT